MKIIIKSEQFNKDNLRLLLQAIRDCEQKNFEDKEIFITVDAPSLGIDEIGDILKSVRPPYNYGPIIYKVREDKRLVVEQ
jgi:hypothetical protein